MNSTPGNLPRAKSTIADEMSMPSYLMLRLLDEVRVLKELIEMSYAAADVEDGYRGVFGSVENDVDQRGEADKLALLAFPVK